MVWISIVASLVVLPPIVRMTSWFDPCKWYHNIQNSAWCVWAIIMAEAQPPTIDPTASSLRVIIAMTWIASMIIGVAYR